MTKRAILITILAVIVTLIMGCGAPGPTPKAALDATNTPLPPTDTPAPPPTDTPTPPPTKVPPTDPPPPTAAAATPVPTAEGALDGVQITFVNNDGFLIAADGKKILIDVLYNGYPGGVLKPVVEGQPPFDAVDLILATHEHQDHYSPQLVAGYMKQNPDTVFVSSQQAVDQLLALDGGLRKRAIPIQLKAGEREKLDVNGIALEAMHISHGMPNLLNLGFVITVSDVQLFHTGDIVLDDVPISYLQAYGLPEKQLDVAFVPYFVLTEEENHAYALEGIQARYVVPMHYDYQRPPSGIEADFPNAVVFQDTLDSWVVPVADEAAPTAGAKPSPSANAGELIAFYSERDGNAEIYVMAPDGSGQTRLTDNAADDTCPDWSPDGRRLVFVSDRDDANPVECFPHCNYEIYVMNADGSGQTRLTDTDAAEHHPAWSPDGTQIAFVSERNGNQEIYVMEADGGNVLRLTDHPAEDMRPSWSPDGSQIVFNSMRDGNWELYRMDADGNNPRRLTTTDAWEFFPTWSPDGKEIAYFACDPQCRPNRQDIYVMTLEGVKEGPGAIRRLTDSPLTVDEDPAWSPDGKRIVFQSDRDGNFELYTMNADGSDQQRLTHHRGGDYWPSWGPALATTPDALFSFEKSSQTFASVPTWEIGLADLDNDDDLDVVFANAQTNDSQVWLNDDSGFFIDSGQKLGKYAHGIDVGDIDGDGDPDVIISTHQDFAPSRVYLNDGNAVFQMIEGAFDANIGFSVDLVDIDGDGDLDAVGEATNATNLYVNDGTGRFGASETTLPLNTIWGDLDSDGDVDVFIKKDGVGYSVRTNDGEGSFRQHWNHPKPTAMDLGDMALGDVDNDGDLDAVVTNGHFQSTGYPALIFLNDGTGRFTDSGQRLSAVRNAGVSLGDLDGDGDLDLVLTDYEEPNQIWINDGTGQYSDSGFRFGENQFYRHAHLGDLDQDGDLDIFLATFGISHGPNEIWFNTTPAGQGTESTDKGLYLGQTPPGLEMEVFAPGIVSIEEGKEYKIAFSSDLQEIFFTRRTPGGRDDRLWYSRLENGKLTTPELAPFGYDSLESDACFTPDGKRLYFNSWRPLPGEETPSAQHNVWFVDKTEDGWGEPQFLGPPLNDYRPVYFSIADDGTIYFTRSRPREIWYAEPKDGQYLEAQRLPDEVNYLRDVAHPAIAPDESYIIVDSYSEQGGRLVGYLYISFRKPDGTWTQAVSLREALKASDADVHASPRITPDGKYLFFEEYDRQRDQADIYWVSTKVLEDIRAEMLK